MSGSGNARFSSLQHRVKELNQLPRNPEGEFVLYWMTSCRRFHHNAALERSIQIALEMDKPLLVVEAVSIRHRWTSDRILTFFAQGVLDNQAIFDEKRLTYVPWVETHKETGNGLLRRLSRKSCAVVIDNYPTYLPREIMNRASEICYVSLEAVDSNGVLPMDMADDAHMTAYSFRKHMQRNLVEALATLPIHDSMASVTKDLRIDGDLVESIFESSGVAMTPFEWIWRVAQGGTIGAEACYPLSIDHDVTPVKSKKGGRYAALIKLEKFIDDDLDRYDVDRNDVDDSASSGLSPWFHFGHLSTIEVVLAVLIGLIGIRV